MLEDRAVPAAHTWTGAVNNLWSEPGNWNGGAPTSGEEGGTVVSFQGNTASVMDIAELQVAALELVRTNNTITLGSRLGATALETRGGAHTITGAPIAFTPNDVTGDSLVLVNAGSTLLLDSPLTGFLTLRKNGDGALSLRDGPDAGGTIFLEKGTLEVSAGGFLGSSVLLLGGVLTGEGTVRAVAGDDRFGAGLIVPGGGASTRTLTIGTGDFVKLTYRPSIAGVNSDRINLIGLLDLTGASLDVQLLHSPTGLSYVLIDNAGTDAVTGTFNGLAEGAAVFLAGRGYTISYAGGDGNDVVLTRAGETPAAAAAPVPPPALPSSAPAAPAFSGARVVGDLLVLSGGGVPGGVQFMLVPPGSSALFADVTGDGAGDVVLFLPDRALVFDGRTGRLLALVTDVNGDGSRDLQIFHDGGTTRVDGRTGLAIEF